MKKLLRNTAKFTVGLLLGVIPAMAGYWVKDIHATTYNPAWYGDTVYVPSGATVAYYANTYGGAGSYASVYATAPGVYVDLHVYDNASNGGNQTTTAAGAVDLYLDAYANGGSANCGVTLVW